MSPAPVDDPRAGPPPMSLRHWLAMMAAVFVPAALSLATVRVPQARVAVSEDGSPYGYTVSLLFWLLPDALLLASLWRHLARHEVQRRAVLWTLALLVPLGFLLDLLLGSAFFTFPYEGATLGLRVPVVGGTVPVEEFFFYGGGFMAILLGYVWLDRDWLARYHPTALPSALWPVRAGSLSWGALPAAFAVVAAAAWYQRSVGEPSVGVFPGYLAVLVAVGVVPTLLFARKVAPIVNWQAFGVTAVLVLAISLVWEATLALPYQWWGYRAPWMTGVYIPAWAGLPIEEPFLWSVVTWATIVVFEVVRVELARPKPP